METLGSLRLEQKFRLQVLREQVKDLKKEEAQEYLVEVLRQLMVKDNMIKSLLSKGL